MRLLNETFLLCEPSLLSGTVTVIGALLLLLVANFSYLLRSGLLYDAIFGKNSSVELIQTSRDTASALNQTVFGNETLNHILFFGFWMVVGLFVYVTIMAVSQSISELGTDLKSLSYIHARKILIEQNLLVRTAIRAAGFLSACIFGWIFVRFLVPFSVLATRVGFSGLEEISGWFYLFLGTIVLILSIHIMVIIARVIVVRPRVFGSWDGLLLNEK
jgi:hypothetical protein